MAKRTRTTPAPMDKAQDRATALPASTLSASPRATDDDVARRAYELFERDGSRHGRDVDHWLTAEQEIRGRSFGRG
jgi:hypothetical protein